MRSAASVPLRTSILIGLLALATACSPEPRRPNVLLITVDTLRADRVSALGGARETTPELDRLAAGGLLFTHAQSPRAKTTPAIASLMTGLYPHEHGARDLLMPLGAEHALLAERFRDAGYRTGAIVGNFVLKDEFSGLARGFDLWTEDLPDELGVPPDRVPQRTARGLTDGALAALGLGTPAADAGPREAFVEGEPWFLWLHYMDPHGSYEPPPEHRVFASAEPEPVPFEAPRQEGSPHRHHVAAYNVPDEARLADGRFDAARVRDLYDGEVRFVDAEIGRLLRRLETAGVLGDTLVVVTADHGESLGEHRYWFEHGRDAYEACARVPLIVRLPDGFERRPPPGRREGDVSLADLGPTLLDLVRLEPLARPAGPDAIRGVSRAKLVLGLDDAREHPVFVEKVERTELAGAIQHKAVRIGDWKLVRRYAHVPGEGGATKLVTVAEELYELASDPAEERDLSAGPPKGAPIERLREELTRFAAADAQLPELAAELQRQRERLETEDRETLRIIEALGY